MQKTARKTCKQFAFVGVSALSMGVLFALFHKSRKSLEWVKPVFWSPLDELSASAIQGAALGNLTYQLIDGFLRERKKR